MAKALSTEKSTFIDKQMQMYASNKVGQYSKFLNKNPIFVTYYSINLTESTADVGTGAIDTEIGPNSPIKYNKIEEFPVYGLPELKPDVIFDEHGMDIEMELSDIVVLPNTITPRSSDFILVKIPGNDISVLFRVNTFSYNTIQSNDFYTLSIELKRAMLNANVEIDNQVVETYICVFDNIGTQDKCLIKTENIEKLNTLYNFISEITDAYESLFYYKPVGNFAYRNCSGELFYDMLLSKFLTSSQIFFTPNTYDTMMSSYDDTIPFDFDLKFNKTLWYTILNKSTTFLDDYTYCYASNITKKVSPFKLNNEPCYSYKVFSNNEIIDPESSALQYDYLEEYFPFSLINSIKTKTLAEDSSYIETLIFKFVTDRVSEIDYDELRKSLYCVSRLNLYYIPIIIFIIKNMIQTYFNKHDL